MAGCDVLLQFAIQLEVALARDDLDFRTRLLFPQWNARIERLILHTADQLDPQRVAFVFVVGMGQAGRNDAREREHRSGEP